jgi:eukaryotic-like serine/threonine-protein kinase
MQSTTFAGDFRTRTIGSDSTVAGNPELLARYQFLLEDRRLQWMTYHRLDRVLGSGGQGIVFYTTRSGADGFAIPVAMKVFSPERFGTQGRL